MGAGGMGISEGKILLYTAAAGAAPPAKPSTTVTEVTAIDLERLV